MANQIGPATYQRCAWHMQQPGAKAYELSHVRSNTMPLSPFAGPYTVKPKPTSGIPGTAHAFNMETLNEGAPSPAQQGTQMDALGHFGVFKQPWDGKSEFPRRAGALYYGGFTQQEVKPTPDSPLLKLGIDKVPPIVTSAVLLDAKAYKKKPWKRASSSPRPISRGCSRPKGSQARRAAGRRGLRAHRLGRPLARPDTEKFYYTKAPGLSYDAAQWLAGRRIVLIALDTPFVDTVAEGLLQGKAGPRPAPRPGCRSRCTTTCWRRPGSTSSRTRSSTSWPPSASGPRAP